MIEIKKEIYYKSFWGIKKVKVLGLNKYTKKYWYYPEFCYKYLIQFPNGKIKLVKLEKIIEVERV